MIIHFTTIHARTDTRIRIKEVATLARAFDTRVCLYVQDGLGNEIDSANGIEVVDTGPRPRGRLRRMTLGTWKMYRAVRAARPAIAHFHDPELIPVGIILRLTGVKVIYDVHEDVPQQILSKPYIPLFLRRPIASTVRWFEWIAGQMFSGIVPATQAIAEHFPSNRAVIVQNYPLIDELTVSNSKPYCERSMDFAYVGGLTAIRGTQEMVNAIGLVQNSNARLHLAGSFSPQRHQSECAELAGWSKVNFHGYADRARVAELLDNVRAGVIVSHSLPRHLVALPTKLFEYMAVGLPTIVSDFPLLREIVQKESCGLLVDPGDQQAIAQAMDWILDNPVEAEEMGRRGQYAVRVQYNWQAEADKLVAFYNKRLGIPLKLQ